MKKYVSYAMYALGALLFLRMFGYRNIMLAGVVFAISGAIFISAAKRDKHGAVSLLIGLGLLGVALQIVTGSSAMYAISAADAAMTSTPLTDFFLSLPNVIGLAWAIILRYT